MYNRYKLKVTKFEGISQCISEVIVEKLRGGAKIAPPPGLNRVNQWRNTTTVIDWFKSLKTTEKSRFVKFDIVEFYPSISEELLERSITHYTY